MLGASNLALVKFDKSRIIIYFGGDRNYKIPYGPEAYIANYSGHELV